MKRNIMLAVWAVLALYALTGCQLAQNNSEMREDKLIGVLITAGHLDLNDGNANETTVAENADAHPDRLYATYMLTGEEKGDIPEADEYVFENVEGIAYLSPTIPATAERESYIALIENAGISDAHKSLSYEDGENSTTMEATIYVTPLHEDQTYYCNPVYQSTDGSVYAVSEFGGFLVNTEAYSEGPVLSFPLHRTTTVRENGETVTESTSITIGFSVLFAPEKIIVLQMDENNQPISQMEYSPDSMPERIMPEVDTVYFIVETIKRDESGSPKSLREIYDRDTGRFATFSVREDGICIEHWTEIAWN